MFNDSLNGLLDADDLLGKPFGLREFVARCRILLRRSNGLFGFDDEAGPNAIEPYIGRLRRKLAVARLCIVTVRGVGYRIEPGSCVDARCSR